MKRLKQETPVVRVQWVYYGLVIHQLGFRENTWENWRKGIVDGFTLNQTWLAGNPQTTMELIFLEGKEI